jgi:antitoxin YefM
LLSTSANTKRLMESIAQDKTGKAKVRELNFDGTKPNISTRKRVSKSKSK